MRIYRIYTDSELRPGAELALDDRAARHLVKVLRHRAGDRVTLFDGRGREASAEIVSAHRQHGCRVRVVETAEASRESPLRLELLPAVSRGEKMDLVIQKSVELGVTTIRPIITERSEFRPDQRASARLGRWREIVIAACEQSGRARLPEVHAPVPVEEVAAGAAMRLVLDPESAGRLTDYRPCDDWISIAIGPEGGFSDRDLALLERVDFKRVGFGPRILRTETAGIAAVSALQALYGDLGGR